jgi:hypothetical protein
LSIENKYASFPSVGMLPYSCGNAVTMATKYHDISLMYLLSSLTKRKFFPRIMREREKKRRNVVAGTIGISFMQQK